MLLTFFSAFKSGVLMRRALMLMTAAKTARAMRKIIKNSTIKNLFS